MSEVYKLYIGKSGGRPNFPWGHNMIIKFLYDNGKKLIDWSDFDKTYKPEYVSIEVGIYHKNYDEFKVEINVPKYSKYGCSYTKDYVSIKALQDFCIEWGVKFSYIERYKGGNNTPFYPKKKGDYIINHNNTESFTENNSSKSPDLTSDVMEQLINAKKLLEADVITKEEFETLKKRLLNL